MGNLENIGVGVARVHKGASGLFDNSGASSVSIFGDASVVGVVAGVVLLSIFLWGVGHSGR